MILLLRKPYFHGNKNIHEYFVFCSQVKFIFGTLGKRKSINYLVVMKTLLPCYSPNDALICCICSLGQKTSDIKKSPPPPPQEQVIWWKSLPEHCRINLSRILKFSTRYCFIYTTLWDDGHTQRQREVKHGCMSGRRVSLTEH